MRYIVLPARSLCLVLVLALFGCASKGEPRPESEPVAAVAAAETTVAAPVMPALAEPADTLSDAAFEDYGDESLETIADPLEGWNRFWFGFNDVLLLKVMKPVYTGYAAVTPEPVRSGLSNILHNVQMPIRLVNCVLQGRFGEAWIEFGRFVVNSTAGIGGLFDVAKQSKPRIPVDTRDADFGQTLGVWGFGEGIYLVWPLVGPSTVRDTVGLAGDWAVSPLFLLGEPIGPVDNVAALGVSLGFRFNDLGVVINTYEALTRSAVEPYIAARDAYIKYRRSGALQGRFQW